MPVVAGSVHRPAVSMDPAGGTRHHDVSPSSPICEEKNGGATVAPFAAGFPDPLDAAAVQSQVTL